jgi:hypothetical protein
MTPDDEWKVKDDDCGPWRSMMAEEQRQHDSGEVRSLWAAFNKIVRPRLEAADDLLLMVDHVLQRWKDGKLDGPIMVRLDDFAKAFRKAGEPE